MWCDYKTSFLITNYFISMKVSVADRNVIQTTDAERRCTDPPTLQTEVDSIVAKFSKGRSFVR